MEVINPTRSTIRIEHNLAEGWLTVLKDDQDDEGRYHPIVLMDLDVSHHPYGLAFLAITVFTLFL